MLIQKSYERVWENPVNRARTRTSWRAREGSTFSDCLAAKCSRLWLPEMRIKTKRSSKTFHSMTRKNVPKARGVLHRFSFLWWFSLKIELCTCYPFFVTSPIFVSESVSDLNFYPPILTVQYQLNLDFKVNHPFPNLKWFVFLSTMTIEIFLAGHLLIHLRSFGYVHFCGLTLMRIVWMDLQLLC